MPRPSGWAIGTFLSIGATVAAQAQPAAHLVGNAIGGHLEWHAAAQTTTETVTLRFVAPDGTLAFTVDFVCQYPGPLATAAPAVVDMIVTQHAADGAQPQVVMQADGDALPVVTRPRTARSVVASMSFDEFARLARAGTMVQRAFGAELEFGSGQLRMLRAKADRWAGR